MNAEKVDSPTAVGVKGSSPLEVRKTFSMVLLEVQILLHTPVKDDYSKQLTRSKTLRGRPAWGCAVGSSPGLRHHILFYALVCKWYTTVLVRQNLRFDSLLEHHETIDTDKSLCYNYA